MHLRAPNITNFSRKLPQPRPSQKILRLSSGVLASWYAPSLSSCFLPLCQYFRFTTTVVTNKLRAGPGTARGPMMKWDVRCDYTCKHAGNTAEIPSWESWNNKQSIIKMAWINIEHECTAYLISLAFMQSSRVTETENVTTLSKSTRQAPVSLFILQGWFM